MSSEDLLSTSQSKVLKSECLRYILDNILTQLASFPSNQKRNPFQASSVDYNKRHTFTIEQALEINLKAALPQLRNYMITLNNRLKKDGK